MLKVFYLYLFYGFLRFRECVFLPFFIIICSYFIYVFWRGKRILCILFFILFMRLACRGFYKPVLGQHDQCCTYYYNDIICISVINICIGQELNEINKMKITSYTHILDLLQKNPT